MADFTVIGLICYDIPEKNTYECTLESIESLKPYVDKIIVMVYSIYPGFDTTDFNSTTNSIDLIILDEYMNKYESIQMFLKKYPSKANDRLLLLDPPDFMIDSPIYTENNSPGFQKLYQWEEYEKEIYGYSGSICKISDLRLFFLINKDLMADKQFEKSLVKYLTNDSNAKDTKATVRTDQFTPNNFRAIVKRSKDVQTRFDEFLKTMKELELDIKKTIDEIRRK